MTGQYAALYAIMEGPRNGRTPAVTGALAPSATAKHTDRTYPMVEQPTPPGIPPNQFELGRAWGHIESDIYDDSAHSDSLRIALLSALIDYVSDLPDEHVYGIRAALADAYANFQCHGVLSRDSMCPDCGATR